MVLRLLTRKPYFAHLLAAISHLKTPVYNPLSAYPHPPSKAATHSPPSATHDCCIATSQSVPMSVGHELPAYLSSICSSISFASLAAASTAPPSSAACYSSVCSTAAKNSPSTSSAGRALAGAMPLQAKAKQRLARPNGTLGGMCKSCLGLSIV